MNKKIMLMDILIVYVIITILLFIFSVILVEEKPVSSIIVIMIGLVFCVYCAFGFSSIDIVLGDGTVYSDTSYFDSYGIGFVFFAFFFVLLFFRAGMNYLKERLEESGNLRYK